MNPNWRSFLESTDAVIDGASNEILHFGDAAAVGEGDHGLSARGQAPRDEGQVPLEFGLVHVSGHTQHEDRVEGALGEDVVISEAHKAIRIRDKALREHARTHVRGVEAHPGKTGQ